MCLGLILETRELVVSGVQSSCNILHLVGCRLFSFCHRYEVCNYILHKQRKKVLRLEVEGSCNYYSNDSSAFSLGLPSPITVH